MYIVTRDGQPTRWDANDGLLPHTERDPRFPLARGITLYSTERLAQLAIDDTREVIDAKHGEASTPVAFEVLPAWEQRGYTFPFSLLKGEPSARELDEIADETTDDPEPATATGEGQRC